MWIALYIDKPIVGMMFVISIVCFCSVLVFTQKVIARFTVVQVLERSVPQP